MGRKRYNLKSLLLPVTVAVLCLFSVGSTVAEVLPTGSARPAVASQHFPDRLHTFVWRNWESVSLERMAKIVGTTPENIRRVGASMGLPPHINPPKEYQQRGYISIIRRNWHLLPYEQLLTLLDWDAEKLAFALREDDFLWHKLGLMKPACPRIIYVQPDESTEKRCAEIRAIVSSHFGDELAKPAQPRFDFIRVLSAVDKNKKITVPTKSKNKQIRFIYSYFAVYGDPLLNPQLDPYPEGLLQRLAEQGVNGVWLHVVLRQLAPSKIFPEFGADHETRLANLRKMVERAERYGIKIYLYLNEPRAMPASFFEGREHIKGVHERDYYALCTSTPEVRQWIAESLTYVFRTVPGLGGVFTISGSENLTNCASHGQWKKCPRCKHHSDADIIAEVNATIEAGVHHGNPNAEVIVWDWGWKGHGYAPDIIAKLPESVCLMSVSEWGIPIVRGGVASAIGEYSMSTVGPGPRALRHWSLAKKRGLKTIAKVQVNCTWELSALPYLPVMNLVAQHCNNLAKADIDGLMLSWTLGGYPSPNLELVKQFESQPPPTIQQALMKVATARYGKKAVPDVLDAWSKFSDAFTEFPFGLGLYVAPMQYGPSNLLYPEPTGYRATMIGFPYDDVKSWQGKYPAEVIASQFEKIANGWQSGLDSFRRVLKKTGTPLQHANARKDFRIAQAAYLHFKTVANQVRFTLARNALLSESLNSSERENHISVVRTVAANEIQIAKHLFTLTRQDSRIGFEASNHYYYFPLDLVEKVINCECILNDWLTSQTRRQ